MALNRSDTSEMHTIVFVDAVNFTKELKTYGRAVITPKINQLRDFTDFFFVYKLGGKLIGQMGDGFLVLCPPAPAEVINEALACQNFIEAYNNGRVPPAVLNTRIAIHYGLIAPPERGNYVDTNLNLTARLEGATPPNSICTSSVLYEIVADVLRGYEFQELESDFKGLGQNKYYIVTNTSERSTQPTRHEARLSFYFSTVNALRKADNWESVRDTCEQALIDFPDNPEFLSQLAGAYYRLNDHIRAIRYYEKCIDIDYRVSTSFLWMARSVLKLGKKDRAMEIYKEAAEKDARDCWSRAEIAEIYLEREDYVLASQWAKKSLKSNPYYVVPVALLIVIALKTRKGSLTPLVEKIDIDRRDLLKSHVEKILNRLGGTKFSKEIKGVFKSTQPPRRGRTPKASKKGRK